MRWVGIAAVLCVAGRAGAQPAIVLDRCTKLDREALRAAIDRELAAVPAERRGDELTLVVRCPDKLTAYVSIERRIAGAPPARTLDLGEVPRDLRIKLLAVAAVELVEVAMLAPRWSAGPSSVRNAATPGAASNPPLDASAANAARTAPTPLATAANAPRGGAAPTPLATAANAPRGGAGPTPLATAANGPRGGAAPTPLATAANAPRGSAGRDTTATNTAARGRDTGAVADDRGGASDHPTAGERPAIPTRVAANGPAEVGVERAATGGGRGSAFAIVPRLGVRFYPRRPIPLAHVAIDVELPWLVVGVAGAAGTTSDTLGTLSPYVATATASTPPWCAGRTDRACVRVRGELGIAGVMARAASPNVIATDARARYGQVGVAFDAVHAFGALAVLLGVDAGWAGGLVATAPDRAPVRLEGAVITAVVGLRWSP